MIFPLSAWFSVLFLVHYSLRTGLRTLVRLEDELIDAQTADVVWGKCYANTGDYNAAGSVMGTILDNNGVAMFAKWDPSESLKINGAPCFYLKSWVEWKGRDAITVWPAEKLSSHISQHVITPSMRANAHRVLQAIRFGIAIFCIFYIIACLLGRSDEAVRSLRNSSASPKKHEAASPPPMPPLTTDDTAFSYPDDSKHLTHRHVPAGVDSIPLADDPPASGRGGDV